MSKSNNLPKVIVLFRDVFALDKIVFSIKKMMNITLTLRPYSIVKIDSMSTFYKTYQ